MTNDESLFESVQQGDADKVKELIAAGVQVNVHGSEQEWTPLNYAAGKGDLAMVKLLVETGGADVFLVGRDNRTPYKIALAAGHADVARYLAEAEEKRGGDQEKKSSREHETRPYCKAYHLGELRKFQGWTESKINWKDNGEAGDGGDNATDEFSDDDVVFLHRDLTVTQSMFHNENVIMNEVTPQWQAFCTEKLAFSVPDDFDLIPPRQASDVAEKE